MHEIPQSPLLDTFSADENVELIDFGPVKTPLTFGQPQLEYANCRTGCAMVDLPQRGLIEVTGKDRHAFLNNLVSNRLFDAATKAGVSPGSGIAAMFLNLKGRVVAELNLFELGDRLLIECDARQVAMLSTTFDAYRFSEKVAFKPLLETHAQFGLFGRNAGRVLGEVGVNVEAVSKPFASMSAKLFDLDATIIGDDSLGPVGFRVIAMRDAIRTIWLNLIDRFGPQLDATKRMVRPVGWAAVNAVRIEKGVPLPGIEYEPALPNVPGMKPDESLPANAGVLPAETGRLARFVDFNKGCYLGQEIVARMHARGQVARKIVGFRMDEDALPDAGSPVFDANDQQVGIVSSSTSSPILSHANIGLALVKKPNFEIGTTLRILAEGATRSAKVVDLPFVDD